MELLHTQNLGKRPVALLDQELKGQGKVGGGGAFLLGFYGNLQGRG